PEDTPITILVATDIDSTSLTTTCTPPAGVHDNGDGTITWTPPLNFDGVTTLTCNTTDDQGATTQSSATVNVTTTPVNDAPVAVADPGRVNENDTAATNVVGNDTDVDGPSPLVPVNVMGASPAGSTATVNGDGTVQFTPPAGYTGPASF